MTKRLFDTAHILIYDPVATNGNMSRGCLLNLGYRNIELVLTLAALENRLRLSSPDLVLCEVAAAEEEICRLIQSVRQGIVGESPFPVVIVTTWRRDSPTVGQVLKSGADDLVARPMSASILDARIKAQIERRKLFVITSNYIGPDRRSDPSRSGPECIAVPNPLQLKAREGLSNDENERYMARAIVKGKKMLNLEKMRRDAVQLCVHWRNLEPCGAATPDFFEILTRMARLSEEIKRRADATEYAAACDECDLIIESVAAISHLANREEADRSGSDVDFESSLRIVGRAALAVGQMFVLDGSTPLLPKARPRAAQSLSEILASA